MSDLQTTFYIMGIVYMSIMFLIMLAVLAAILTIKHKIVQIQRNVEEKINSVTDAFHTGEEIVDKVKGVFGKFKS